jgi:hypothetical protein
MIEFEKWWFGTQFDKGYWESHSKLHQTEFDWARLGFNAALEAVIAEWEKPYGLTDGRKFIDRLRGMKG